MSQETIISLIILGGVLTLSASYFFIFGFLMPRRLERKLEQMFASQREMLDSLEATLSGEGRATAKDETPPPSPEEFVDLTFVRCERGPRDHRQPLDGEWEANFVLRFSAAPVAAWARIFEGLRLRQYRRDELPASLSSYVTDDKFIFYCDPRQLQAVIDRLAEIVAETNRLYRRRLELAEVFTDDETVFEELVDDTLQALKLPTQSAPAETKRREDSENAS